MIRRSIAVAMIVVPLFVTGARADSGSSHDLCGMLGDDAKYTIDNTQMDLVDIVTSPLHIADENSVFRSPRFYLVTLGVGALWGGAYALDQTMRSHLHNMSSQDADLLQNVSYASIAGSSLLLYSYGLYDDDDVLRQHILTAGEAAALASLTNVGIKAAFGRLRPYQGTHAHDAFFRGGQSFVSGDVVPMFALAAGISEAFDNAWYVAAPVYSLALLDGFGRMGHDAHWFSDVVGAGLLGWGTTELFLYLHDQHAQEPSRWRIFPMPPPQEEQTSRVAPTGLEVAYNW
jgi:membrane-associated phospholipid phosphatase